MNFRIGFGEGKILKGSDVRDGFARIVPKK